MRVRIKIKNPLAHLRGASGVVVRSAEANSVVEIDYTTLISKLESDAGFTSWVTDLAAGASPVQSVAGRTGNVVITASDLADFNTAACNAVLPITSANVSDFNTAARAAVLPVDYINITNVHVALANVVNVATNVITVCDVGNVTFVTAY